MEDEIQNVHEKTRREVVLLRGELDFLRKKIEQLERPHHTVPKQPITDIDFDENFDVESIDGMVTVKLDIDGMRKEFPFPPTSDSDRYHHCTEPDTFSEILLPTSYADAAVASGANDVVFSLTKDGGGELCYWLVEANVKEPPTQNVIVIERHDICNDCTSVPESGDTGDPGTPYYNGTVVTDIDCADDGSGDLIITKYNSYSKTFTTYRKTGCCCDDPPTTGGTSGDTMDRWEVCATDPVGGDDIYLNISVKDNAPSADPSIQIDGTGCCYTLAERSTTGNIETVWVYIEYEDTCGAIDCGCPVDCFATCQQNPTSTPTGSFTSGSCSPVGTPASMPDAQNHSSTAEYHQWTWAGNNTITGVDTLSIRCNKTTGEVAATITAGATTPSWGGNDTVSGWSGYKVMTGVTCSGAELAGTLVLDGLTGGAGCEASQWTVVL